MKLMFTRETTAARQFFALFHSDEIIQMHHKTEVINQRLVALINNIYKQQLHTQKNQDWLKARSNVHIR